jgi:hypothetical protein
MKLRSKTYDVLRVWSVRLAIWTTGLLLATGFIGVQYEHQTSLFEFSSGRILVGNMFSQSFEGWSLYLHSLHYDPHLLGRQTHSADWQVWKAVIPLWPLPAALAAAAWLFRRLGARALRRVKVACPSCGYDRAGLALDSKCPECGMVPAPAPAAK